MRTAWETDLAAFLKNLSAVQTRTLDVLARRRAMLAAADAEGLAAVGVEEGDVVSSLQQCLDERETLLRRAREEGLPSDSIRSLTKALRSDKKKALTDDLQQATARARLLQHNSLVNWVIVQKTLLHLSQLLEIIATGGRLQPTYGKAGAAPASGALVDRAV
jgi:hypothetical protein